MGLKICITGKYGPAVSIDLYSETGKAAKKNTKKRNSISWKTTRNYRDLHEKKIPDVQNLEDETRWDLNVSLGLVSFICGHLGTLYDDDDKVVNTKYPIHTKKMGRLFW